jgi:serine/threonine protein kinase
MNLDNFFVKEIEKTDDEKTGSIYINKDALINIEKMKDYCSRNIIFSEKYELLDYIDSGNESIVYSCFIKNKKNKLISKIIFNKKKEKINRKELEMSTRLKHKNIINIYAYSHIIKKESWCMIMEYAKYGNLSFFRKNILKRLKLSESMICFIAYQILGGLDFCYLSRIAHMDLKAKNIVVDEFLNMKIIDFSISIDYRDKKPSDLIKLPFLGTSFYMPLEIIVSQKIKYRDLNRIDLYALGVILYNLAFGKYPYNLTYDDEENYEKISQKLFINNIGLEDENNEFSEYFLDFLNKLLEKDITKRINIIEAKNHYWIKGSKILLEEKENINNINLFINYLLTNHIKKFNDYIEKKN